MPGMDVAIEDVRRRVGSAIFSLVAGADGPAGRERLRDIEGARSFPLRSPIGRVHADASMFVGGLSALLLQSLHPLAMAGVAEHSDYRGDPWGRLARTSHFLATTTYGTPADAKRAVDTVRAIHRRVRGVASDGRRYSASDPHLLSWVHVAEVTSFLAAHRAYGADRLNAAGYDEYVAQSGEIAAALGAREVPGSVAELRAQLDRYRPELRGTSAARAAARYLVFDPPLPFPARGAYVPVAAAAVALLPRWARWPLRLPWLPVTEATVVRGAGDAVTRTIRWALSAPPATDR